MEDSSKYLEKIRERWNPATYEETPESLINFIQTPWFEAIRTYIELEKYDDVLEVGSGGGKWSACFALYGCNVTVVDILPEMLLKVHNNFPQFKFNLINDDARTLEKIENEKFSIIFSDGLVEHFLDENVRRKVIKNMIDKAKFYGVVIYTVPIKTKEEDEHYYESPEDALNEIKLICDEFKISGQVLLQGIIQKDTKQLWAMIFLAKNAKRDVWRKNND